MEQLINNLNWPLLHEYGILNNYDKQEIINLLKTHDVIAIFMRMRRFLEKLLGYLYKSYKSEKPTRIHTMIDELSDLFPKMIMNYLHSIRKACNNASHPNGRIVRDDVDAIKPMFVYVCKFLLSECIQETLINTQYLLHNSSSIQLTENHKRNYLDQQKKIDEISIQNSNFKEKIRKFENEKQEQQLKLNSRNEQIKNLIQEISIFETQINKKNLEIQLQIKKIDEIVEERQEIESKYRDLKENLQTKQNFTSDYETLHLEIKVLKQKYSKLKINYNREKEESNSTSNELLQRNSQLKEELLKLHSTISILENELNDMGNENKSLIIEYNELLNTHTHQIDESKIFFNEWLNLGKNYYELNQFDKAEEYWNKCFEINPNNYNVTFSLGTLYFELSNFEKAEYFWTISMELEEKEPTLYESFGKLKFLQNKFEEAEIFLKQYFLSEEANSDNYFILGQIVEKDNRLTEAQEYYRKVKDTDPNYEIANLCIESIEERIQDSQEEKFSFNSKKYLKRMNPNHWYNLKELMKIHHINDLKEARYLQLKLKQFINEGLLKFKVEEGTHFWMKIK